MGLLVLEADDVERVLELDTVRLLEGGAIGERARIRGAHRGDDGSPLALVAGRLLELVAEAEGVHPGEAGQDRIVEDELAIRPEPFPPAVLPLRLDGARPVGRPQPEMRP